MVCSISYLILEKSMTRMFPKKLTIIFFNYILLIKFRLLFYCVLTLKNNECVVWTFSAWSVQDDNSHRSLVSQPLSTFNFSAVSQKWPVLQNYLKASIMFPRFSLKPLICKYSSSEAPVISSLLSVFSFSVVNCS